MASVLIYFLIRDAGWVCNIFSLAFHIHRASFLFPVTHVHVSSHREKEGREVKLEECIDWTERERERNQMHGYYVDRMKIVER